ncbi:MAG: hypothetical protein A2Y33_01535 [Spirochaetes bacterium GWF1_51_8]|nr:MAG: hypothetical protein A2Y33_01535 [Spirochaetes bacterium GWF1_51_8]
MITKIYITLSILTIALLASCGAENKTILYYQHPHNPQLVSAEPMRDEDGHEYIPVYAKEVSAKAAGEVWYYTCSMHPEVKRHEPGNCPICKMELVPVEYPEAQNAAIEFYFCPMHPEVRSEQPGKCPICGMDLAPKYITDKGVFSSVQITPEQEKLINVRLSEVKVMSITNIISTVGKIGYNEQKLYMISARIDGRIDKLFVNYTGAAVSKNQPLLLLYSPMLITAQEELLLAYKDFTNAQIGQLSQSLLETAKKKLSLLGVTASQIDGILKSGETMIHMPIYAPASGTVLKLNAVNGMYVMEGDILYEIADLSTVWMEAEIYEEFSGVVQPGMEVTAVSVAYPDQTLKGKISFVYPVLDPMTRTFKIRAEFDNKSGLLKPGMYVDASIKIKSPKKALVIPDTALLDTGMRKIVYVSLGNGKYEGREVIVMKKAGGYYPVLAGLKEGEIVVTHGAYLIDSQAQLSGSSSIQYSGSLNHEHK